MKTTSPTLYLARHGETDNNAKKIFQGIIDAPLNNNGILQAEAMRNMLADIPITRVFCSPLIRAVKTASIILFDRNIQISIDPRLVEINFGAWEQTPEAVVMEKWPDDYNSYRFDITNFRPEGGESSGEVLKRAASWWDDIQANFDQNDSILVVAHQFFNAVLACHVAGYPLNRAWKEFKVGRTDIIKITPGSIPLVSKISPNL